MASQSSTDEEYIPLAQVSKLPFIPRRRRGRKLHSSTVFRWAQKGLNGVRLRTTQFGGTKVTTVTWLQDFFARLSTNAHSGEVLDDAADNHRAIDSDLIEGELDSMMGSDQNGA